MTFRKLSLLVMVFVFAVAALPVNAQDDALPEDQAAIVEFALETLLAAEDYTSYVAVNSESRALGFNMMMGETPFNQESLFESNSSYTFVDDGNVGNFDRTTVVTAENTQNDVVTSYVINAQTIVVDGEVYVNAAYETADDSLPALPEGWTAVTPAEVETFPGLSDLDLDNIFESIEAGESKPFTSDYDAFAEAIRAGATEALMEEGAETEDGRVGTAYLVYLDVTGVQGLLTTTMGDEANPIVDAMIANAGENSSATFGILVDDEGNIAELVLQINLEVIGLDVSAIDPNVPAETVADMFLTGNTLLTISDVNADLPLAEVPAE